MIKAKPPETIWLQHGDPYNPVAENTWCVEPMGVDDCDTEYTRTDTITDKLRAALDDIARQQHPWEMEETDGRDFEYAYNEMIRVARKALQKWEETQNDK